MLVFPEVQKKAQEEIDRVVGPNRLPEVDDYPNLPYIRCCVKETLRWMPTVVLGVPHRVMRDDEYMGYKIPKGASVINNVWYVYMVHISHETVQIIYTHNLQVNPYGSPAVSRTSPVQS